MMDGSDFDAMLRSAKDIPDIFELVKKSVSRSTGRGRSGLMLGLAYLGGDPAEFVGAFYPLTTNIIVMNKLPLERIKETDPALYNPYVFHILLHEYLHTLGIIDEESTRSMAYRISEELFGKEHTVTKLAADLRQFMPNLVCPVFGWKPSEGYTLELVDGFDRSSTDSYIG